MRRLIPLLILLGMLFSLSSCNKPENYESQIYISIGLSEEDGLRSVMQTELDKKQHVTVFLQEPINRDAFLSYLPVITEAVKTTFGSNIERLGTLTIYLSESDINIMTCRTDVATDMQITAEYYDSLGNDLAYFGNNIYDNLNAYSDLLSNYSNSKISVYFHIKNSNLLFNTGLGKVGSIVDTRNSDNTMKVYNSYEELASDFPALKIHLAEKEALSDTDLAIYQEVWAALDAEPDKSEEDIFKELAPQYGMSEDELKDFISNAMEKIYG